MSRQKRESGKGSSTWSEIRNRLERTDLDYVVGIVKMLFDLSEENRRFLTSRLFPKTDWSELLEKYLEKVRSAVLPDPPRRIRLGDARKAINEYRRSTSDLAGTVDLMVTYVESGTECARSYGVDYESFYTSLLNMWNDLVAILSDERNCPLLDRHRKRLLEIGRMATDVGWGYDESVTDLLADLGLYDEDDDTGAVESEEGAEGSNPLIPG